MSGVSAVEGAAARVDVESEGAAARLEVKVRARGSPSESETVGTPARGVEAFRWSELARTRTTRERSGARSPTASETDSERSSDGEHHARGLEGASQLKPAMQHKQLVTNFKAQARKHDSRTSLYRGVSLLRQTGKFHAQINVQRKQLHLGFFFSEEEAARAYDRAAIFKASVEGGAICTNMDINDYKDEIPKLQSMTQQELLAMLHEMKVKSNESSAPSSPRKPSKPKLNLKQLNRERRVSNSEHSETEHATLKSLHEPSSPRFEALSTAVGVVQHSQNVSVASIAASVIVQDSCPSVIDMHISKRRRTRVWPRQAPAAA